jgi:transcriptional regulator with XRE-family HTH domain
MRVRARDLHAAWLKDRRYRKEYDALGPEFDLAGTMIAARTRAQLSQGQLAKRMGMTQPFVARLESGRARPSTRTLQRFARATGTKLRIVFEPDRRSR